jgi:hypothetical protein
LWSRFAFFWSMLDGPAAQSGKDEKDGVAMKDG